MSKEAMKLALEALQECRRDPRLKYEHPTYDKAIKDLEEALAKQEQGEPVAWISWNRVSGESKLNYHKVSSQHDATLWSHFPLYTTPQQRTWVGLDEEEQGAIMESLNAYGTNLYHFANAIEAKLKEKNT